MDYTKNLNLKKLQKSDHFDLTDFNENFDKIDRLADLTRPDQQAALGNNDFRGDDLFIRGLTMEDIYSHIADGSFEDIYVGDYIPISGTFTAPTPSGGTQSVSYSTKLRVAGINTYLATGATLFDKQHIVMIPDDILLISVMNSTATAEGGYFFTFFRTKIAPVLKAHFAEKFGDHLLTRSVLISNGISATAASMAGAGLIGCSNSSEFSNETVMLPSEIELFGCTLCGSSNIDIGTANRQLPLFRLAPEYVTKQRQYYWLSAVADKTRFVFVDADGACSYTDANYFQNIGVRPILVIGGD